MLRTIVIILALALCSCTIEQLFPEEVANGIARLSVNNMGNLLRALNHESTYTLEATDKRTECNFLSRDVTEKTTIFNDSKGQGRVQSNFDECVYDFGTSGLKINIPSLCGHETATVYGKVVVSGHRIISGILTGNSREPVIPSGNDGIQFHFSKVQFTNFRVVSSTIDKAMTITSGSAAFDVAVHLAKSQEKGFCEIPLPNLTVSNIQYSPGAGASETIVQVPGPFGVFSASIDRSLFSAQVGIHQGLANHLEGEITVWGKRVKVPGNDPGLNPSFSVNAYHESLTCTPDLAIPVEEGCPFEPDFAGWVSRLTVRNFGNILAAVTSANNQHVRPECRLGSLDQPPTEEFPLDGNQAEIVWKFNDCEFEFKDHPGADKTSLNGKVRLSGERRVKGFHLKGNQKNPVIPGKGGVHFSFSHVEFDNYGARADDSPATLTMVNGAASFDAHIHFAKSKSLNVCSIYLINPTLNNIKYTKSSDLVIGTQLGDFHLTVQDSLINAQVNRHNGVENSLAGYITIFGKPVSILPNYKLDPWYKESDFDTLLAQTKDLMMPLDHECEAYEFVEKKMADGVARLTINSFGRMLESITSTTANTREECQLGSGALTDRAIIDHLNNSITWRFDDCEFALNGKVKVSGTRTIKGFLTGDKRNPIVPSPGSAVDFHFSKIDFDSYRANYEPHTHLTIVSGAAAFDVSVPFGRNASTGLCSVATPNLTFKNVRYLPGSKTKVSLTHEDFGISNLELDIESSNFDARFGYGHSLQDDNMLKGSISILGRSFSIPTDGLGLNPNENHPATFEELLKKIPELATTDREQIYQCEDFERVRALNIARLMILNTGSVTQESYDEYLKSGSLLPNCGFSSNRVRMFGKRHSGSTGQLGELHFTVDNCTVVNQPTTKGFYEKDCLGDKTVFEGKATISGTQKVKGLLGKYWGFDDIMPNIPQAISFDFDSITLDNFASYYVKEENDIPPFKLKVSGTFDARVSPILSPKRGRPCEFFRSTPVVSFELHAKNELAAHLELKVDSFSYATDITIYAMNIRAQNGVFQGKGNSISGEININHKTFYFDNELLNPYYNQEQFDKSYKCRELYAAENEYSLEYVIPHWEGWEPDCKL